MGLKTQIEAIMQQIDSTTELFYQQKEQEAYNALDLLLAELVTNVDALYKYKLQNKDFLFDVKDFQMSLVDAMNALEEKDTVLLADVLKYDIYEKYEAVVDQL